MSMQYYNLTNLRDCAVVRALLEVEKNYMPFEDDLDWDSEIDIDQENDFSFAFPREWNSDRFNQSNTLRDVSPNQIIMKLTSSIERQHLYAKRKYVDKLPTMLKNKVWNKILKNENLSEKIRLESVKIFLDKTTKYFSFILTPEIWYNPLKPQSHLTVKTILELIPNLAPNIETINFVNLPIVTELKNKLKFLLNRCRNIRSLRFEGINHECAIFDLIFRDFNSLDRNIKWTLKKIQIWNIKTPCSYLEISNIFNLLPNLESIGPGVNLGPLINHYVETNHAILKLTDIYDCNTTLTTLNNFAKICPKTKLISLDEPQEKVVKNLHILPLITIITLFDFNSFELHKYLKRNGFKIKVLRLYKSKWDILEHQLRLLCPNLEKLEMYDL